MKIKELNWSDLEIALKEWNIPKKHPCPRFGQWFFNTYLSDCGQSWPELFYEEDMGKSIELLKNTIIINSINLEDY